jgi:uncharacterized protein (TIGR03437 family)
MRQGTIAIGLTIWGVLAALPMPGHAQALPPSILTIDETDLVNYNEDISDVNRFATSAMITPVSRMPTFINGTGFGDIVAVNGAPAKGLHSYRYVRLGFTPTFTAGQSIADVVRLSMITQVWEILNADGTAIGSIMVQGFASGAVPPGSPAAFVSANNAIVGGTGAFAGIRGTQSSAALPTGLPPVNTRQASVVEDPAYRRINRGGTGRFIFSIVPAEAPAVVAVLHADWSPVTEANPARAGETLTLVASGLGPTRPSVDSGKPFPAFPGSALHVVNSPVEVMVNGQAAAVVNAIGMPETVNRYRVDFQVPAGVRTGTASVHVAAAWMHGQDVQIAVR